ncbi:MAG: putative ABC transporter permease [Lachnospiraceae bacterium]|nr:putative ABC transporter permease [Lachnospiraceae bacterium]
MRVFAKASENRKKKKAIAGQKKQKLRGQDIYVLGMMIALISFLGFLVENLWLAFTKGYINNRNMNAPFLLGYGALVLAMYFMFGTPEEMNLPKGINGRATKYKRYAFYFLGAMVFVCIAEIVLGASVERLCGIEYWNYSKIPLHITKYTSIPTSAAFASMITLFMGRFFQPVLKFLSRLDERVLKVVSVTICVIMLWDFVLSFGVMIKKKSFYLKWKIFFR